MIIELRSHYIDLTRLSFVSPLYFQQQFQPSTNFVIGRSLSLEVCFGGNPIAITLFQQTLMGEPTYEQAMEWAAKGNEISLAIMTMIMDWLSVNNQAGQTEDFWKLIRKNYPEFRTPALPEASS